MSNRLANIILTVVVLFLSVLLILDIFEFRDDLYARLFTIGTLVGIAVCGVVMVLRGSWKANFTLLLMSTILTVYSLEILVAVFVGLFPPVRSRADIAHSRGLHYDPRTKLQVIEDMRAQGIDAHPNVLSCLYFQNDTLDLGCETSYPLGGISNKLAVLGTEDGNYCWYENDEYGFNNPKGLWAKGSADIVLIGDSFTHGAFVQRGEDVGSQLRKLGRNVMNLGNGCSGPLVELARIKEYARVLSPRRVLMMYFEGNDLSELQKEKECAILLKYLEGGFTQNLFARQEEIDEKLTKYVKEEEKLFRLRDSLEFKSKGLFLDLMRLFHLRRLPKDVPLYKSFNPYPDEPVENPDLDLFRRILLNSRSTVSSWGGELIFVFLPAFGRYSGEVDTNKNYLNRDDVLSIVNDLNIKAIDFHTVISRRDEPKTLFPFEVAGHYTAEGYRLLAELIDQRLREQGL